MNWHAYVVVESRGIRKREWVRAGDVTELPDGSLVIRLERNPMKARGVLYLLREEREEKVL